MTERGFNGHVRTHGLTIEEYVNKYGEYRKKKLIENNKDKKIQCLICKKWFWSDRKLSFHLKNVHNIKKKDYVREYIFKNEKQLCKCGCGKEVEILSYYPYRREYISGHNSIGETNPMFRKSHKKQSKQKMSKSAKKRINEYKKNNTIAPWKSKKAIEKRAKRYSESMMRRKEIQYKVKILERNKSHVKFQCNKCNNIYEQYHTSYFICPNCYPKSRSKIEGELYDFLINECNVNVVRNSRSIIPPFEIDFYIKNKNIGIELNGLYYHTEISGNKPKKYHINKTKLCHQKKIQLIHIFEDEWRDRKEIVKYRLQHLFGISKCSKIYARKCQIKEISTKEKNQFLIENHLQGKDISKIKLGLFYKENIVSVMTFSDLRFALGQRKKIKNNYELVRFCSNKNFVVVGGASKLLSYFIKTYNPNKIISYADKRWSIGNLYEKIGFKKVSDTPPNYWYTNDYKKRIHRFNFTKGKLVKEGFDKSKTEWEIMQELGYDRVWDCGSIKYELIDYKK